MLSAMKTSPLGAVAILRGFCKPAANSETWKALGARGMAPVGRRTGLGKLFAEGVSNGLARSLGVISRLTPGASVVQSPRALWPVNTSARFDGSSPLAAPIIMPAAIITNRNLLG